MVSLLVSLLIIVIVGAIIYWLVTMLPIPQPFKNIVVVIVVLIMLVWLLQMLGVLGGHPWRVRL
jgi:hypothetical protein